MSAFSQNHSMVSRHSIYDSLEELRTTGSFVAETRRLLEWWKNENFFPTFTDYCSGTEVVVLFMTCRSLWKTLETCPVPELPGITSESCLKFHSFHNLCRCTMEHFFIRKLRSQRSFYIWQLAVVAGEVITLGTIFRVHNTTDEPIVYTCNEFLCISSFTQNSIFSQW